MWARSTTPARADVVVRAHEHEHARSYARARTNISVSSAVCCGAHVARLRVRLSSMLCVMLNLAHAVPPSDAALTELAAEVIEARREELLILHERDIVRNAYGLVKAAS